MRAMQIDFATASWRSMLYRVHPAFLAAGVLGMALLLAGAAFGVQAAKQQAAREESLRAQERKQAAAVLAPWHGLFVLGKTLDAAFDAAERIDVNARCILLSRLLPGEPVAPEAMSAELEAALAQY